MLKKYNITVNGNTYEVEVEEVANQTSQVSRPQTTQSMPTPKATPQMQNKAPMEKSNTQGTSILAPMPGTINDVRVKVGDSVSKGQVLLILEAMKMENEIMANNDGTVTSVNVSKGTSVSAGDVLITIE